MNDMTGHNSGTAAHQLNAAIARLGLALQDARSVRHTDREQMVLVARCVLNVDAAAADNEAFADAQIKAAGIVLTSDLIANAVERSQARWLARGGIKVRKQTFENPNDINDLTSEGLNPIEARFMTGRKFAKITAYKTINDAFSRECKAEIRRAGDGGEGAITLDEVRSTYADTLFKTETVEAWIAEDEYRRSDEYARIQNLKKAWALRVQEAIDEARQNESLEALDRLEAQVKKQLAHIHALAAQHRAEKEAKARDAELTAHQRRTIVDNLRRATESEAPHQVTDDDF